MRGWIFSLILNFSKFNLIIEWIVGVDFLVANLHIFGAMNWCLVWLVYGFWLLNLVFLIWMFVYHAVWVKLIIFLGEWNFEKFPFCLYWWRNLHVVIDDCVEIWKICAKTKRSLMLCCYLVLLIKFPWDKRLKIPDGNQSREMQQEKSSR